MLNKDLQNLKRLYMTKDKRLVILENRLNLVEPIEEIITVDVIAMDKSIIKTFILKDGLIEKA